MTGRAKCGATRRLEVAMSDVRLPWPLRWLTLEVPVTVTVRCAKPPNHLLIEGHGGRTPGPDGPLEVRWSE